MDQKGATWLRKPPTRDPKSTNMDPQWPQISTLRPPGGPKGPPEELGGPKKEPKVPKWTPERSQRVPKWSENCPKTEGYGATFNRDEDTYIVATCRCSKTYNMQTLSVQLFIKIIK